MQSLSNSSCFFFAVDPKIQADPKIHIKMKGTLNSQNILEKKEEQSWRTLPDFKTYYKATVINTV